MPRRFNVTGVTQGKGIRPDEIRKSESALFFRQSERGGRIGQGYIEPELLGQA